jgi:hypothetical protein
LLGYNPAMLRRFFLACSLLVLVTACTAVTSEPLPTLMRFPDTATPTVTASPEPTRVSPTMELASQTPQLLASTPEPVTQTPQTPTLTPELVTPIPESASPELLDTSLTPGSTLSGTPSLQLTLDPTPTLTATLVPQPDYDSGKIQILSPGPLSKIVASVAARGYAVPGDDDKGQLELYGEDGRLLASELLQLNTPYKWAPFYWELAFKTTSVGELGRLSLSTQDEYGRVNAVNSVHILLLTEGQSIINQPGNLKERCVIEQPVAGQRLSGGVLTIVGRMRPFNNLPLTVELISRAGNVVGTQQVPISLDPQDAYVPFRVDIPYSIPDSLWALLVVRQDDDRIGGIMYLYSQELFINP